MRKIVVPFLFLILCFGFSESPKTSLHPVFLNLEYKNNIYALFDSISQRSDFQMKYTFAEFKQSAEFYAKYKGQSELYPDADSVIVHVLTCNDMSTFFTAGTISCKSLTVQYYLQDTSMVRIHFARLDSIIQNALRTENPDWVNHPGASKGVYFPTEGFYPFIIMSKHNYKKNYISVEFANYER